MTTVPAPGVDEIYRRELLSLVQADIDANPRSAQAQIGPSEAGGCPTKVAWKMEIGGTSDRPGGWAAAKGTRYHAWMDEIFQVTDRRMPDGSQRFFSDLKLKAVSPLINGGTLDVYDRLTETVTDLKFPGDWTMKAVRNGKLSPAYFTQIQLYCLGLQEMGFPVSRAALLFMPACGDDLWSAARGAILRTWPYDRQAALDAVDYVRRIRDMIDVAGIAKVLEVLPKRSDFCSSCPASIMSGDRRATCPGVVESSSYGGRGRINSGNPFASSSV